MKKKALAVIDILKQRYPDAPCALHYQKDYELMIAVRLSAQCTDARVNLVTPKLFAAYPTLEAMAAADITDVENHIHSCGFYRQKAKDIVLACQMLLEKHGGKVPNTMEALLALPGVGRKTANVIRGNIYNEPSIVVDTHVKRISKKLGLSKSDDPVKAEQELMKTLPKDHWILYNIQLITFGREICKAPTPKCEECFMTHLCPDYKKRVGKRKTTKVSSGAGTGKPAGKG